MGTHINFFFCLPTPTFVEVFGVSDVAGVVQQVRVHLNPYLGHPFPCHSVESIW